VSLKISSIEAKSLYFKDEYYSTKDLSELMMYKLPCKFVAVQPENKKTPELVEFQAFSLDRSNS